MFRCPECSKVLSAIIEDDGKCKYTCSCGFNSKVFPIVKGVIVKRRNFKSGLAVLVACPFCGLEHYHSTQLLPGLRKAHCRGLGDKLDIRTVIMLEKYLKKYPLAYKGGTYYVYVWEVEGKGLTEQKLDYDANYARGEISREELEQIKKDLS